MNDLMPFVHGEEGTHSACPAQMARLGGGVPCCECSGHDCDADNDNFCRDKDCRLYVVGGTHRKGTSLCKYG